MAALPASLQDYFLNQLDIHIRGVVPVSGGSINRAAKIETSNGDLFLKWNNEADPRRFKKEAAGLEIMEKAATEIRIPERIAFNDQKNGLPGFLLMEYIEPSNGTNNSSHRFGEELAKLHSHTDEHFGLDHDNYIGRLPQSNKQHSFWADFFRYERIEPQLKMAAETGKLSNSLNKHWERLSSRLDDIFPETKPALLHGDLWGGNYFFDEHGDAVLIDPAVYYGHPEMEISFTRMFGGFSEPFYEAYRSAAEIHSGFSERVAIYNLYPLLVHVNLFGGHYARQAASFLKQY